MKQYYIYNEQVWRTAPKTRPQAFIRNEWRGSVKSPAAAVVRASGIHITERDMLMRIVDAPDKWKGMGKEMLDLEVGEQFEVEVNEHSRIDCLQNIRIGVKILRRYIDDIKFSAHYDEKYGVMLVSRIR